MTVAAGLALLAAGLVMLSQVHIATSYDFVAAGLAVSGLGTGVSISAAMSVVMEAVGGDEAGTGASLNSALRQVGGAVAVAVLGSVLSSAYARHLRPTLATLPAGGGGSPRLRYPGHAGREPPAIEGPSPPSRGRRGVPPRLEHGHAPLRWRRRGRRAHEPALSARARHLRHRSAPATSSRDLRAGRYATMTR